MASLPVNCNSMDIKLQRKRECTNQILQIKKAKNLTWENMAKAIDRSPVWVTACCLGIQNYKYYNYLLLVV